MKRIGIFLFYDPDGNVSDFLIFFLNDLKKNLSHLIIVVNGQLSLEGKSLLGKIADEIIIRPNKGFDSWAYKTVFEEKTYEYLYQYDELVLVNCTCYGPLFPFADLFSEMEKDDCDFWGITKHPELKDFKICEKQESSDLHEHIQTYFVVIRSRLLHSEEFKNFWKNQQEISTFEEAVGLYEIVFTKHFEDLGYKSSSYIPLVDNVDNAAMFDALSLMSDKNSPILKRKLFALDEEFIINRKISQQPQFCLDYLESTSKYDTKMIIEDMLRTKPLPLLKKTFHWNFILSAEKKFSNNSSAQKLGIMLPFFNKEVMVSMAKKHREIFEKHRIYIFARNEYEAKEMELSRDLFISFPEIEIIDYTKQNNDALGFLIKTIEYVAQKEDVVLFITSENSFIDQPKYCTKELTLDFLEKILALFDANDLLGYLTGSTLSRLHLQHKYKNQFPVFRFSEIKDELEMLNIDLHKVKEDYLFALEGDMIFLRSDSIKNISQFISKSSAILSEENHIEKFLSVLPYFYQHKGFYSARALEINTVTAVLDDLFDSLITSHQTETKEEPYPNLINLKSVKKWNLIIRCLSCFIPLSPLRSSFRNKHIIRIK